ncbi:MAG: citrate synthase/methylcitrate synthase [Acidimicrobiia bacterium]|nr:citrate synthase/methylcitrate synthase [Acidimicrobiia bacterium]
MELIEVPPGLAGVAVTATSIGDVVGDAGFYHYRGRSAIDLASSDFESVASLVLDGSDEPALGERALPADLDDAVLSGDLRSAISALGAALSTVPLADLDPAERRRQAAALAGAFPTLVASQHLGRRVEPDPAFGHVANYLAMLHGEAPPPALARALETYFILTIEHGFNAGSFTARVVASTGADLGACVLAAFAALTGPGHGAVQTRVLDMFAEIGEPDHAEDWMRSALASRQRVLGIGHAVYRTADPRAAVLAPLCAQLAPRQYALATAVETAAAKVLAGRRLAANVDLYAPVLLEACGIPRSLFTATFACARVVGWCAHILEQATERKIIRPAAYYVGPPPVPR